MWADAQRDGRPVEYRCPLLNAAKFCCRPLLECRAVTLPIYIGEHKIWTQSEFCTCQNSRARAPLMSIVY